MWAVDSWFTWNSMKNVKEKIFEINDQRLIFPPDADHVLCTGHFNIIHPGHLRFLEDAKKYGKTLVVAIQSGEQLPVKNDASGHFFSEEQRANAVANLQAVDFVVRMGDFELRDIVAYIRPKFLILGNEFKNTENKKLQDALKLQYSLGGKVEYHAGEVHYASLDFIKIDRKSLEDSRIQQLREVCVRGGIDLKSFDGAKEKFSKTKLLVIGESIVDQYTACDALGMSAEAPIIVLRELDGKSYVGGAAIVAEHIRALGAETHFISIAGNDEYANFIEKKLNHSKIKHRLHRDYSRPTIFKQRFLVENQKIFRLSRLKEHMISNELETQIIEDLGRISPLVNGIVISDFSYGMITKNILNEVRRLGKLHEIPIFGDAQTSSQLGSLNGYFEFDTIFPTEREARLFVGSNSDGIEAITKEIFKRLKIKNLVLKLGSNGMLIYKKVKKEIKVREYLPALCVNPLDVAGAGDSLLASMVVCRSSGFSLIESAVFGSVAASVSVQSVGNTPIQVAQIQKILKVLLQDTAYK